MHISSSYHFGLSPSLELSLLTVSIFSQCFCNLLETLPLPPQNAHVSIRSPMTLVEPNYKGSWLVINKVITLLMCCGMIATLIILKYAYSLASITLTPWLSLTCPALPIPFWFVILHLATKCLSSSRLITNPMFSFHSPNQSSPYPQFQIYPK